MTNPVSLKTCGQVKKMNRSFKISVLATTIILLAVACTPGDPYEDPIHVLDETDTIPPVVNVAKPAEAQIFKNGEMISVEGSVTDTSIYRGVIKIVNHANGAILKEQAYEIHGFQVYYFSMNFVSSVAATTDATVQVSFEDHGKNTTVKTVAIKIIP